MSPTTENIVHGAASVRLFPAANYDLDEILSEYEREARRRGVKFDEALIAAVSKERRLGAFLFEASCLAFIAATVMLAYARQQEAIFTAAAPAALYIAVAILDRRLRAAPRY